MGGFSTVGCKPASTFVLNATLAPPPAAVRAFAPSPSLCRVSRSTNHAMTIKFATTKNAAK
jgi:hypothetical protein